MKDETPSARRFYDRIAASYDALADASEREVRQRGVELLGVQLGERVLELGFGTGHALCQLAAAVGPTGRVCGVDISPRMCALAERRVAEAGLAGRVELTVAEAPPLPYPDAGFDAVFASFTLELFPPDRIPTVLAEVRRVLRPGGRLGVVAMSAVPAGQHESLLEKGYRWLHQHFPHIVDCRPIDAAGLLRAAGFEVEASDMTEIWTLPVVALVARAGA